MSDLPDAVKIDDDEPIDESRILERTTRRLALLPMPEGLEGEIEVVYRETIIARPKPKTPKKGATGGSTVSCAVCVTVTDPDGTTSTVCKPIPCPTKASAA
jgi:hypothetical protein